MNEWAVEPEAGPEAEGLGAEQATGHERVDAAIGALDRSVDLPPREQIAEYEAAHRSLQETLASIDEG